MLTSLLAEVILFRKCEKYYHGVVGLKERFSCFVTGENIVIHDQTDDFLAAGAMRAAVASMKV